MPKVLPVGSVVEIVSDSISHKIPLGAVTRITNWDGDTKAPVYRVEGYITDVWFTNVKLAEDQSQPLTEPTGPAACGGGWRPDCHAQTAPTARKSLFSLLVAAVSEWWKGRK